MADNSLLKAPLTVSNITAVIEAGADVNEADKTGQTALMKVAKDGKLDCPEALINLEADVNHKDKKGDTALDLALFKHNHCCVLALVEAGTVGNMYGLIPLLLSSCDYCLDSTLTLKHRVVSLNESTISRGLTPYI